MSTGAEEAFNRQMQAELEKQAFEAEKKAAEEAAKKEQESK